MDAQNLQNFEASLLEDRRERFQGLRSTKLQTTARGVLDEYEAILREYEEKIRALRERHISEVKSTFNSGALINQLPNELLMHIFRVGSVGPRINAADAIRLTHICRLWRSLIHETPTFWSDFLDAEDVLARKWTDNSIVLAAFERSQPVTNIHFSLYGSFLPLLETIPDHALRISTLWLDATVIEERDVRPFFRLEMPHLEDLTLWMSCSHKPNQLIEAQSSTRFPKLRNLQTNCVRFSISWVNSAMRSLWLGTIRREDEGHHYPDACCQLRSVDHLLDTLARCPDLAELVIDGCLPKVSAASGQRLSLDLPNLEVLVLRGETSVVRSVAAHIVLPDWTEVALSSHVGTRYYPLSKLLPTPNTVSVSSINHLSVDVGLPVRGSILAYTVRGEADDGHGLELGSYVPSVPLWHGTVSGDPDSRFDLLRFFQGFVPIFPPSSITSLKISSFGSFPDSGGFPYLFQSYPQLTDLTLALTSLGSVLEALAEEGVAAHLQTLEVCVDISRLREENASAEHETMVSVLEARAARGLRLESFSFTVEMGNRTVYNEEEVPPPPLTDILIQRLGKIIPDLYIEYL